MMFLYDVLCPAMYVRANISVMSGNFRGQTCTSELKSAQRRVFSKSRTSGVFSESRTSSVFSEY